MTPITPAPATFSPTLKKTSAPTTLIPTQQPIGLCDNSVCELSEDSSSCPSDCADVMFPANDVGAKGKFRDMYNHTLMSILDAYLIYYYHSTGAEATMFSVKASGRNIKIKSFDFFTNGAVTEVVQVYTRPGEFRGFEQSAIGWQRVYSKSIAQFGRNVPTSLGGFDTEVVIPANSVQSFLVYTPNKVIYKQGTSDNSEGTLFSSDITVELYEGIGLSGSLFSNWTVYSPRVFRCSLIYDVLGEIENPTTTTTTTTTVAATENPTGSPTKEPTKTPSATPSLSPSSSPLMSPSVSPSAVREV